MTIHDHRPTFQHCVNETILRGTYIHDLRQRERRYGYAENIWKGDWKRDHWNPLNGGDLLRSNLFAKVELSHIALGNMTRRFAASSQADSFWAELVRAEQLFTFLKLGSDCCNFVSKTASWTFKTLLLKFRFQIHRRSSWSKTRYAVQSHHDGPSST